MLPIRNLRPDYRRRRLVGLADTERPVIDRAEDSARDYEYDFGTNGDAD